MKRAGAMVLAAAALAWSCGASADTGLLDSMKTSRVTGEANKEYHQGRYDSARAGYMRAKDMVEERSPESYRLHYNIGASFYKEGNYDQAEKEFQQARGSQDPELSEAAVYNLGNVYFQKAMQDQKIETLEKAVENYQAALQMNPDNEDARFNIEVVRRLIDLKKQQQQQQPQACPNPKTSEGQEGQEQKPSDQARKGQEQGEKKENKEAESREGQEQQQASMAQGSTAQPDQPMKPAGSDQAPGEMSEDEARRILQAVQEQEADNLKQMLEASGARKQGDKDW